MTNHQRTPFPIDGIDSGDIAGFLVEALAVIRQNNDLADLCALLTRRLGSILPITGAAVVVTDGALGPVVASASVVTSASRRVLEDQLEGDLVRDCLVTGQMSLATIASGDQTTTIHVLPVGAHDTTLGSLVLVTDDSLTPQHLDVAGIFVDIAAVAFLQAGPHLASASSQARFTHLLRSLDTIEQAKGMLSQRHGIGVDAAFEGLWQVALDHGVGLSALAAQVVNRALDDPMVQALASSLTNRASAPTE